MKKPSIDRKDNDGNYTYENCRFIEMQENRGREQRKEVLQFDLKGNFIREWISASFAGKTLHICISTITYACRNNNISKSTNSIWKYRDEFIIL